jgi:hypothetical protein
MEGVWMILFLSIKKPTQFHVWYVFLTVLLCVSPWHHAFSMDTAQNRSSLRGLDGVGVLVEPLDPEIEAEGLKESALRALMVKKLQGAGIRVNAEEDFIFSPGRPAVYLNAEISKLVTQEGAVWGYLCSLDIALTQNVYLVRSPEQAVPAATWETGFLGLFPDMASIRKIVEQAIDTFIHAYQLANKSEEKGMRKR